MPTLRSPLGLAMLLAVLAMLHCHSTGERPSKPTLAEVAGSSAGGQAVSVGGSSAGGREVTVGGEAGQQSAGNGGQSGAPGAGAGGDLGAAGTGADSEIAMCTTFEFSPHVRLTPEHAQVEQWLSQLSLEQQLEVVTTGGCAALGLPPIAARGGALGVAHEDASAATTWPGPVARAATFDLELEARVGEAQGAEMAAFKYDLSLAPTVDIMSNPRWAGSAMTYGEDPVLAGEMAAAFVRGMQQHVPACPKRFVAPSLYVPGPALIAEQPEREFFLLSYQIVVEKSDPACILAGSHSVNGEVCTESSFLLDEVLRGAWNWQGLVASEDETPSAAAFGAGVDLSAVGDLSQALEDGLVSAERVEQAARRILNVRLQFEQHTEAYQARSTDPGIVEDSEHQSLALEAAIKSAVLLKNEGLLPLGAKAAEIGTGLETFTRILVMGPDSDAPSLGKAIDVSGPNGTKPPYLVSFLDGLAARAGAAVQVAASTTLGDAASADLVVIPVAIQEGATYPWGLRIDEYAKHWAPSTASTFIKDVAAVNPNVVVLLAISTPVILEDWVDSAGAVVQTFHPGQEAGNAIAALLFGDENFSGKLPFTVAKRNSDYGGYMSVPLPDTSTQEYGYRRFDWLTSLAPSFLFGYGQSYTTYEYGQVSVLCPDGISEAGRLSVAVDVTNTGMMAGEEVVQLFVGYPPDGLVRRPVKELKAFQRVALAPGETKSVVLNVPARDLRYWDVDADAWVVRKGTHTVLVGPSADDALLVSAPFRVN